MKLVQIAALNPGLAALDDSGRLWLGLSNADMNMQWFLMDGPLDTGSAPVLRSRDVADMIADGTVTVGTVTP